MRNTVKEIALANGFTGFLASLYAFTGIELEFVLLYCVIMIADFFLGTCKAYKIGEPITSQRMYIGVITKVSTIIFILILAIGLKTLFALGLFEGMIKDTSYIIKFFLGYLIAAELYSVTHNFMVIQTGTGLPELEAVAMLGRKIRQILELVIKRDD